MKTYIIEEGVAIECTPEEAKEKFIPDSNNIILASSPEEAIRVSQCGNPSWFIGFASKVGSGAGWFKNIEGNRIWEYTCGCVMTSGAGSCGTIGSAFTINRCPDHAYDQDGNLIQD